MRVAIGGIIHDRPTVPNYFAHLKQLQLDGLDTVHVWVVDGDHNSGVASTVQRTWPQASLITATNLTPLYQYRRTEHDKARAYRRLACLRNMLALATLELEVDALVAIDSDIMVPPNLIQALRSADRPWVSALVPNRPVRPGEESKEIAWNVMHVPEQVPGGAAYLHFVPTGIGPRDDRWPDSPVGWRPQNNARDLRLITGAVCWYSTELLTAVRWSEHSHGEDIAFGHDALRAGFSAWYVPLVCPHLMTPTQLEEHRQSCPTCAATT